MCRKPNGRWIAGRERFPTTPRVALGGLVYHVLNRSVGRMRFFNEEPDLAD